MLLAPALGAPPREIAERLGERLTARLGDAVDHVEVAGPGFLNVFLADAWYADAARQIVAAGDDWGRGDAGAPRAGQRRVRLGQPDRSADRRQRPPRRLRRRARAAARAPPAPRSPASTTSTTPARRSTKLGESVRARARHEPVPEDGYQGDYVAELAARIPGAAERTPAELGAQGRGADHGEHPGDARRLPGRVRLLLPRGLAARRRPVADRDRLRPCCASRATSTSPRARCGCAPARSATTRTACSSARAARRRTSRPTSPTTRTRSSAASTA